MAQKPVIGFLSRDPRSGELRVWSDWLGCLPARPSERSVNLYYPYLDHGAFVIVEAEEGLGGSWSEPLDSSWAGGRNRLVEVDCRPVTPYDLDEQFLKNFVLPLSRGGIISAHFWGRVRMFEISSLRVLISRRVVLTGYYDFTRSVCSPKRIELVGAWREDAQLQIVSPEQWDPRTPFASNTVAFEPVLHVKRRQRVKMVALEPVLKDGSLVSTRLDTSPQGMLLARLLWERFPPDLEEIRRRAEAELGVPVSAG